MHSRESFLFSIFDYWEIQNKRWLYLDNQINKLSEDIIHQNLQSLERCVKSLGVAWGGGGVGIQIHCCHQQRRLHGRTPEGRGQGWRTEGAARTLFWAVVCPSPVGDTRRTYGPCKERAREIFRLWLSLWTSRNKKYRNPPIFFLPELSSHLLCSRRSWSLTTVL